MKTVVASLVVVVGFLGCNLIYAQAPEGATLLVLAKSDSMLLLVDPANLQVMARIPAGNDPHEVVASADGKTAYISNYGFGTYNTLTVVDLVARKQAATVDLGALRGPHGLMFAGGKVWFTAEVAKAIGSYDPATQKIDWILGTGQDRTHMIYVWPDLKRIATTNVSSGTVSLIEKTIGPRSGPPPRGNAGSMRTSASRPDGPSRRRLGGNRGSCWQRLRGVRRIARWQGNLGGQCA